MPTSYYWTGTTSTDPNVGTNYTPNGVPVTGDSLLVDGRATKAIAGSTALSAVTLAVLRTTAGNRFTIGAASAPLVVSATTAQINAPADDGSTAQGSTGTFIDFAAIDVSATVYTSPAQGTGGLPPVMLRGTGTNNNLIVNGGNVGFGTLLPGEAATLLKLTVNGSAQNKTNVVIGSGVTLATFVQSGGNLEINCAFTTGTQYGGTFETDGSGTATTITAGGTAILNSTGTVTNVVANGSGFVDCSQSAAARTITNFNIYGTLCKVSLDNGVPLSVATTNGIICNQGAKSSQINHGSVTVKQS